MSKTGLPVLIIGAGTGGLALAHGLKKAGIPVEVYERDRHRAGGLQGYRVGISPNGVRSLRDCLPAELFDTFVATTARDYEYFSMFTERLRPLLTMTARDLACPEQGVIRDYSVSRMTLRQVLLTGLEDIVRFDKTFSHYESDGDTVTAHFEDCSSATGCLLVGADGANSRTRKQYLPHATHTETGLVAIGGKQAITEDNTDLLPGQARHGLSMITDKRSTFGIVHVMEFPWQGNREIKDGIGTSDAELIKRWPGLLFDNTTDYFSWGVSASREVLPDRVNDMTGEELQQLVLRDLVYDWHPNLLALIRHSDPSTTFALNIRTSDPVDPWRPSRITLLGDAVHTMTPGRGAGANTALRDARLRSRPNTFRSNSLVDRMRGGEAGDRTFRADHRKVGVWRRTLRPHRVDTQATPGQPLLSGSDDVHPAAIAPPIAPGRPPHQRHQAPPSGHIRLSTSEAIW